MPTKLFQRRHSAGFTLIEMMIASALLSLTVGGFFATFGSANQYAVNSRLQNSAKVVLGAALNETLGTSWIKVLARPEVLTPTGSFDFSSGVPYNLGTVPGFPSVNQLNAGISPALGNGCVSLFTDPSQTTVVQARLERIAIAHAERSDMMKVGFRLTFYDAANTPNMYRGRFIPPVFAYTVVTRLD